MDGPTNVKADEAYSQSGRPIFSEDFPFSPNCDVVLTSQDGISYAVRQNYLSAHSTLFEFMECLPSPSPKHEVSSSSLNNCPKVTMDHPREIVDVLVAAVHPDKQIHLRERSISFLIRLIFASDMYQMNLLKQLVVTELELRLQRLQGRMGITLLEVLLIYGLGETYNLNHLKHISVQYINRKLGMYTHGNGMYPHGNGMYPHERVGWEKLDSIYSANPNFLVVPGVDAGAVLKFLKDQYRWRPPPERSWHETLGRGSNSSCLCM